MKTHHRVDAVFVVIIVTTAVFVSMFMPTHKTQVSVTPPAHADGGCSQC